MPANAKRKESSWAQFYQMIYVQFPHARVFDLRIRGGVLLGFRKIEYVKIVSREQASEDRSAPEKWHTDWLWFWRFAQQRMNLDLPEVLFRDGRPQMIPLEEGGREFMPDEAIPWNPPNLIGTDRHALTAA